MAGTDVNPGNTNGISAKAYSSDGAVLLTFDLEETLTLNLAGFAIQYFPPEGDPVYIPNRLNFTSGMTRTTTPEQRAWTPSDQAPIQKFRWVDFPPDALTGQYRYEITAMYFDTNGGLKTGPAATVYANLSPGMAKKDFEFGFTRGYASSQAYAAKFKNAPIAPHPKNLDYDTAPYLKQYEWLGYHARKLTFDFLQECLADPAITVDLFAYDLDEPDFIRGLQKLGGRLRAFLDDAPLHTRPTAMEPIAKARLEASAGTENVRTGHFKRFAHNKVLIQKKNGMPTKVLTGSANFSIRGLYIQANNILVIDDPETANLYETAFNQAFNDMRGFDKSAIASKWFDISSQNFPGFSVCFSPHQTAAISLDKVANAIQNAKSSILFAVMELGGSGPVLNDLKNLSARKDIFAYGITQSEKGLNLYKPGETNGIFADFSYLASKVPEPFRAEWSGGIGQVIHDKFVVIDFNDQNPVVFAGSSNLAAGGEEDNGDNLLAIYAPEVVTAYAVEALRLVDHYHFRMVMKNATSSNPLQLQSANSSKTAWWKPYYDPGNVHYYERQLFSK